MKAICFVCLGNIVRSPLAENLFLHLVAEQGLEGKYTADSAGTASYHVGDHPDSRMRQVARNRGLIYDGRARQFERRDFDRFDLIIAMDAENLANLHRMAFDPKDHRKLQMLRSFDPQNDSSRLGEFPAGDVPDPYYGGIDGFENVYDMIERSCRGLIKVLEKGEL
jgi:protein-tyrosine phosphatase